MNKDLTNVELACAAVTAYLDGDEALAMELLGEADGHAAAAVLLGVVARLVSESAVREGATPSQRWALLREGGRRL